MDTFKQVVIETAQDGDCYAQCEVFQGTLLLAVQPESGGPARRYALDSKQAGRLLASYPDLAAAVAADRQTYIAEGGVVAHTPAEALKALIAEHPELISQLMAQAAQANAQAASTEPSLVTGAGAPQG